jgi:hypothetical protein
MHVFNYLCIRTVRKESRKISKDRGTESRDFLNCGIFATIVPLTFNNAIIYSK